MHANTVLITHSLDFPGTWLSPLPGNKIAAMKFSCITVDGD